MTWRKVLAILVVLLSVAAVFFLTFQSAADTVFLSETIRVFLSEHGIGVGSKALRHFVHVPLYFLLGLVVILSGRVIGIKLHVAMLFCFSVGFVDGLVKIPLPTREFDFLDLMLDYAGVLLAVGMVLACKTFQKMIAGLGNRNP